MDKKLKFFVSHENSLIVDLDIVKGNYVKYIINDNKHLIVEKAGL